MLEDELEKVNRFYLEKVKEFDVEITAHGGGAPYTHTERSFERKKHGARATPGVLCLVS